MLICRVPVHRRDCLVLTHSSPSDDADPVSRLGLISARA
jgi:hypothetical protein